MEKADGGTDGNKGSILESRGALQSGFAKPGPTVPVSLLDASPTTTVETRCCFHDGRLWENQI